MKRDDAADGEGAKTVDVGTERQGRRIWFHPEAFVPIVARGRSPGCGAGDGLYAGAEARWESRREEAAIICKSLVGQSPPRWRFRALRTERLSRRRATSGSSSSATARSRRTDWASSIVAGLNRALALPAFIASHFGKPDAIFAPDPAAQKKDGGRLYDYVRPLITIEPTAIAFGLPVHADIGFSDVARLQTALEAPEYRNALVVVAWEHRLIDVVVRALLKAHGADPSVAPSWAEDDFDGVDVVTIDANAHATFGHTTEGLDGQPETCPR